MVNTTETFWTADGVSLQTLAQNIETLGGRDAPPPYRGEDITVPYSVGQTWVPKVPDSRIIPLGMWVRGATAAGLIPTGGSAQRDMYDDNWRALRNLLWAPGRQFDLGKKIKVDGLLKSVVARAEYNGGLETSMINRTAAKFAVDLKLADPYFYDTTYTNFTLAAGDQTITLPGDAPTTNLFLTIDGARTNVVVQNKTLNIQVEYIDTLAVGAKAELDIRNYSAKTTPVGTPTYKSTGKVRHSGAPQWLVLAPGANVINLTSTAGTGAVVLQGKGAWL